MESITTITATNNELLDLAKRASNECDVEKMHKHSNTEQIEVDFENFAFTIKFKYDGQPHDLYLSNFNVLVFDKELEVNCIFTSGDESILIGALELLLTYKY